MLVSQGLEIEMTWLATEQLTVGLNFALIDGEFVEDVVVKDKIVVDKGQDLLRAPKFTASLNLDYLQPIQAGDIRYNMTYSYSSTQRLTNQTLDNVQAPNGSTLQFTKSDIYSGSSDNLNGRITFMPTGESWEVALWATNILDKAYRSDGHFELTNSTLQPAGSNARPYIRNAPRAVGLEFTYAFGDF